MYIPLVLKCFNLKPAKFYYACWFIHYIQIMSWLLNIDFYMVWNIFMGVGLYEVFSSDCIALRYVLYFNFKMITW